MTEISIESSIPHRGTMLLIDSVDSFSKDDSEIVCSKTFRADEPFFDGHYPGHPLVPGVLLCECAAQAAAILLANLGDAVAEVENAVPVLTRMNQVRFRKTVHPGDTIEVRVTLDERVSTAWFLTASVRLAGKTAATLELACTLAEM